MVNSLQRKIVWDKFSELALKLEDYPKTWEKLYILDKHVLEKEPSSFAPKAERDAYKKHVNDALETACLMLATMNLELQKQYENIVEFNMIKHLKILYQDKARHARFEVSKSLFKES